MLKVLNSEICLFTFTHYSLNQYPQSRRYANGMLEQRLLRFIFANKFVFGDSAYFSRTVVKLTNKISSENPRYLRKATVCSWKVSIGPYFSKTTLLELLSPI